MSRPVSKPLVTWSRHGSRPAPPLTALPPHVLTTSRPCGKARANMVAAGLLPYLSYISPLYLPRRVRTWSRRGCCPPCAPRSRAGGWLRRPRWSPPCAASARCASVLAAACGPPLAPDTPAPRPQHPHRSPPIPPPLAPNTPTPRPLSPSAPQPLNPLTTTISSPPPQPPQPSPSLSAPSLAPCVRSLHTRCSSADAP